MLLIHAKRHCKCFFLLLKINVHIHTTGYLKRRIKPITFIIFLILFQGTGQRERSTNRTEKPLKVNGTGAEACAEGPFLKWQNCSSKAAKVPGEREETPA